MPSITSSLEDSSRVSLYPSSDSTILFFTRRLQFNERTANLLTMISNLAQGIPHQVHSLFNTYGIDGLTITPEYSSKRSPLNKLKPVPITALAGVVEATIHAESNLMEPLIVNNFYYLLVDPFHFVASAQYFVTFVALVARLPLKGLIWEGVDWSSGMVPVCGIGALGAFSYFLLPKFVSFSIAHDLLPRHSEAAIWTLFVGLGSVGLIASNILLSQKQLRTAPTRHSRPKFFWVPLDLTSSLILLLFCVTFSFFNFSFCLLAAAVFVPLSVILSPLRFPPSNLPDNISSPSKKSYHDLTLLWTKMGLSILVSPYVVVPTLAHHLGTTVYDLVNSLMEQHHQYATLAFPFLSLVYIPWSVSVLSSLWIFLVSHQ
eukprot:TRINITY_DN3327_c0_g1_i3.p1 TRINITY_DN3327_c0_g1~~TRINITY_DN3327_c0_g1_i3.p1  ORF type:complete len:374 (-),score=26.71 TRINITY_DN3327_c0_g1_i3:31-1152(-)